MPDYKPNLIVGLVVILATALGAAPESVSIAGQVVAAEGQPVAGAQVYVYAYGGRGEETVEARTTSGPDGKFALPNVTPTDAPPEARTFIAVAEGYALGWQSQAEAKDLQQVRLVLGQEATLSGHVNDPAGQPLADVSVRVYYLMIPEAEGMPRRYLVLSQALNLLTTQTDAAGAFTLAGVPKDLQAWLEVARPGYARKIQDVAPGKTADLRLVLSLAGGMAGRVTVAETGNPLAGVMVSCQGRYPTQGSGQATTDAEGRFEVAGLEAGIYNVQVQFKEGVPEWAPAGKSGVAVTAGEVTKDVNLELVPGEVLIGKVTDAATGAPLAGVTVGAYYSETGANQSATTDEKGVFRLRLTPGEVNVNLWGMPQGYVRDPQKSYQQVQIVAGKTPPEVTFSLQRGVAVAGRAVDPDGQPVAEAVIRAGGFYSGGQNVTSDAEGRFKIEGLAPGQVCTLQATHAERKLAGSVQTRPAADAGEVTLKLEKSPTVRGRIVNDEGQPLPDAKVTVYVEQESGGERFYSSFVYNVKVNQEGRYEVTCLIPGVPSYVSAEAEGYGQASTEMSTLVGGEEKDLGDLTLPKADSFLAGTITNLDGRPIAGVEVSVYGGTYRQTVTDNEGKYRLDQLVRGKVQVNLQHPDYYNDYQSDVQTGVENLDFVLMQRAAPPRKAAQVGAPAPELAVSQWLNGEAKLSALRGRVILLAFCPAYSPAGRDLLPQLQALHEQHSAAGLTVVQIVDGSATPEELETFVREAHLTYPLASVEPASTLGWSGQTFGEYGVEAVPAVFLIDKQGVLRHADVVEGLEEKVRGLLAE